MSVEGVRLVVNRAIAEPDFLKLLISKPDQALADYDLTPIETAAFQNLTEETFDAMASELGERISRAGLSNLLNADA